MSVILFPTAFQVGDHSSEATVSSGTDSRFIGYSESAGETVSTFVSNHSGSDLQDVVIHVLDSEA